MLFNTQLMTHPMSYLDKSELREDIVYWNECTRTAASAEYCEKAKQRLIVAAQAVLGRTMTIDELINWARGGT